MTDLRIPSGRFHAFALSFFPGLHDGPPAMVNPEFLTDDRTPASELEEKEAGDPRTPASEMEEPAAGRTPEDYLAAGGRILAWFLEGEKLSQIGLRVLVATHKLRPDLIGGISFQEISQMAGFGRSAAHNLSTEFERLVPVGKMPLDHRRHRRNGDKPGSGRLNHSQPARFG